MTGLQPSDWENMVRRLVNDEQYYEKVVFLTSMTLFLRLTFQWHQYFKKAGPGDAGTRNKRKILCDLLTTSNLDTSKCDEIIGPEL